jgi:hypothetical protein
MTKVNKQLVKSHEKLQRTGQCRVKRHLITRILEHLGELCFIVYYVATEPAGFNSFSAAFDYAQSLKK